MSRGRAWRTCLLVAAWLACLACGEAGRLGHPQLGSPSLTSAWQRGHVVFSFLLADDSGTPLEGALFYRLAGDAEWKPATTAAGDGGGLGLVATRTPQTASLTWDSFADTGRYRGAAELLVRIRNPLHEASLASGAFQLANDDSAPTVLIKGIDATASGPLPISLSVVDAESEALTLSVTFSRDGGANYETASLVSAPTMVGGTPDGHDVMLYWNARHDLAADQAWHLLVRVQASDPWGAGPTASSAAFTLNLPATPDLDFPALAPSLRGEAPLVFNVIGPRDDLFAASIRFRRSGDDTDAACTQVILDHDGTQNLHASPHGEAMTFTWDTRADLSALFTRDVELCITLLTADKTPLSPAVQRCQRVSVNNGRIDNDPMISEIYPGMGADDGFVELHATAGTALDGLRLYEVWPDGANGLATNQAVIHLDGQRVGTSGVFVIAAPNGPAASFTTDKLSEFFKEGKAYGVADGLPNNLILDRPADGVVLDAVGYGDFASMGYTFQGQDSPALAPLPGTSLSRDMANLSCHDNSLDFSITPPTPGTARLWPGLYER